jgi:hypothetical protein
MTIVTGSECVEITTYVAHTDGLKDAAPIGLRALRRCWMVARSNRLSPAK